MKKYLIIGLALLAPIVAYAAENLQQKHHGGAVWVQSRDGTTFPTGGVLVAEMTDLVNAATKYLYVPKTGNIMKVYSVLQGAIVGDSAITIMSNDSNVLGSGETFTNTGHSLTITASGSYDGDIDSSVLTSATTATKVSQGDIIAIVGNGGSTAQSKGGLTFTIVIE